MTHQAPSSGFSGASASVQDGLSSTPTYTLKHLAEMVQGELIGHGDLVIHRVVHPKQVQGPGDLALVLDQTMLMKLIQYPIPTVLLPKDLPADLEIPFPNQLRVERPKVALAQLLAIFKSPQYIESGPTGIHPTAIVHPTASIGEQVQIGPYCIIGPDCVLGDRTKVVSHCTIGAGVKVGADCFIHAGVYLGDEVVLGQRVIIQANAVIGSDGFSYVTRELGSIEAARSSGGSIDATNDDIIRIESVGTVVLEDDVEVGASAAIDRATLGETRIKQGSKIDNLVQVAHNVTIEPHCLVAAQAGIAGSSTLQEGVVLGGQAGIKDHTTVGAHSIIMAQCGVTTHVPEKTIMVGTPGMTREEYIRRTMHIKGLKTIKENAKALLKRVEKLESSEPSDQDVVREFDLV